MNRGGKGKPFSVGKDNDFQRTMKVGPKYSSLILNTLKKDSEVNIEQRYALYGNLY